MKYTIVIFDIEKFIVLHDEKIAKQNFEDARKHFKKIQLIIE